MDGDYKNGAYRSLDSFDKLWEYPIPSKPWVNTTLLEIQWKVLPYSEVLKNSYEEHGDRRSLGQRVVKEDGTLGDYEYLTYKQLYPLVVQLGRSIRKQFPWLERQGRSGFYGKNCRDLQLYSLAMQSQDQISVPIYDTLGEEAVRFVIENSGMTVIAVTEEKLPLLSQFLVNPGRSRASSFSTSRARARS